MEWKYTRGKERSKWVKHSIGNCVDLAITVMGPNSLESWSSKSSGLYIK